MKNRSILFSSFFCMIAQGVLMCVLAQSQPESAPAPDSYPLSVRDLISFSVLNEPETANEQRIDGQGRIQVPYLGTMRVEGLTVRVAEAGIAAAYAEHEIYKNAQVTIRVIEYAQREVSVLGQVNQPGNVAFPIEAHGMDIRKVISDAGGFTNVARSREVIVTRQSGGRKVTYKVNVDRMVTNRRGNQEPVFLVRAGDVIYVPERFF